MSEAVIGRDRELALGEAFLDAVPAGPAALVIDGESGIGKTTVWHEVGARARRREYLVISCRAAQAETALSYAALADLFGGLGDDTLAGLPDPQRRALEAALLRADPVGARIDRRAVFAAVVSTLRALAGTGPVIVSVDDANWLDPASAGALEFAARRLGSAPIGFMVSGRTSSPGHVPLGLSPAFLGDRLSHVTLGPLSLGALGQLLRAARGLQPSRPVLRQIEQASGGNPFFALEIARSLEQSGLPAPGAMLPLPAGLSELVSERIASLPPGTREALSLVAAASHPTVELVGRGVPGGSGALANAEERGLIGVEDGRVRFTHPLFGSAAYASLPRAKRREQHRVLAGLVEDHEERARHLALAADGPDGRVAAVLERAATRARRRGAPEAAAALLEQSMALTPAARVADRRRRTRAAAEDHLHAGGTKRARTLLEPLTRELPAGRARAEALRLLAEAHFTDDSTVEALALLEEALGQAGGDPGLAARIHLDLAYTRHAIGDMPGASGHARAALVLAESAGERWLLAQALASAALVDLLLGRGEDAAQLERAVALEDWDERTFLVFRPSYCVGFIALMSGEVDTAHAWLGRLREELAARGQENDLPLIGLLSTLGECQRGDLASAAGIAEETIATSLWQESPVNRALALSARAHVEACRGRDDSARADAREALSLFQDGDLAYGPVFPLSTLGFLALSLGDPAGADQAMRPLADAVASMGLGEPASSSFLPDEIEALVALGRLDLAEDLTARLEERGQALDRPWALATGARCRALLLAARGDLEGAERATREALRHMERLAMPLELGRTLLVTGQVRRRQRDRTGARQALERALELFDAIGTPLWAAKARAEIARLGVRRPPTELSETEERVARLVASGLTNREVAAKLFISPKTVEVNLAKAYRKLGVRSRVQLGSLMARLEEQAGPAVEPAVQK